MTYAARADYNEAMQNTVLIEIFTELLIKRRASRSALAQKFELSRRTVSRYIAVLCEAGIPIESIRGAKGGYALDDGYNIDGALFNNDEYKRIATALNDTLFMYPDKLNLAILKKLTDNNKHSEFAHNSGVILEIEFNQELKNEIAEWLGEKHIFRKRADICGAKKEIMGDNGLINKLLSFGGKVKVIAPDKIREELKAECEKVLSNYD